MTSYYNPFVSKTQLSQRNSAETLPLEKLQYIPQNLDELGICPYEPPVWQHVTKILKMDIDMAERLVFQNLDLDTLSFSL